MARIAFIGAGSMVFTRNLVRDIVSYPELRGSELALMDIDGHRLSRITALVRRLLDQEQADLKLSSTMERREALRGADYVVITIRVGGDDQYRADIDIPAKYGVSQCVGDTVGPGGIFRGLRHMAAFDEIIADLEDLCPGALVLQYSNPMAILTWQLALRGLRVVGLCHSVQHTAAFLASICEIPVEELNYWVAGINHQAWFLTLEHKGVDIYPTLREHLGKPQSLGLEPVRFELLRRFGYFVTESSGHASEYLPYFRKRPDLLGDLVASFSKPSSQSDWFGYGETGGCLKAREARTEAYEAALDRQISGAEAVPTARSEEYGARIIAAMETSGTLRISGNVVNRGLVTNLPDGCCVEVPCLVDCSGVRPCWVGDLPRQLAALNRSNIAVQEATVFGHLESDRESIYHAMALDPLTASVCSLAEIWSLTAEMFTANETWLPRFRS